jgi:DNA-directed RNA polymerase subunit omega
VRPALFCSLEAVRLLPRKDQLFPALNIMHQTLLKKAALVIPNDQLLINVVRQRVRQLMRGHRPLIVAIPGMGFGDLALSEVIAGKLTYEAVPGARPDDSFVPLVRFHDVTPDKKAA